MIDSRATHLGAADVHLWVCEFDSCSTDLLQLAHVLSSDEQVRGGRSRDEEDRLRLLHARAMLRGIIASYLNVPASELQFSYNRFGKPSLSGQPHSEELCFNLSHSHRIALVGVTRNREIGVDVEQIRPELADEAIGEFFFSPREISKFRALPAATKARAFFQCWTRREAFLKAIGEGFATDQRDFDVSFVPGEPPALLRIGDDPSAAKGWSLYSLEPAPDYVAAVAVKDVNLTFQTSRWTNSRAERATLLAEPVVSAQ